MNNSLVQLEKESMSQLQLCLVMRHFYPILAGAAERLRRYAPGFRARGIQFNAVTRHCAGRPDDEEIDEGIRILRTAGRSRTSWDDSELWKRAMAFIGDMVANEKKSIMQTNLATKQMIPVLRGLKHLKTPAIWFGSMMQGNAQGESFTQEFRRRLRERWLMGSFDALVVGSTAMKQWLRSSWIPESRIHVIGHGVDLDRFRPVLGDAQTHLIRARFHLPLTKKIVLFVGTMTERKGVHLLLEAWSQIFKENSDAHLVVLGGFDRPTVTRETEKAELTVYQATVRQQMEMLCGTGSFTYLGETPEIDEVMRACDMLVLPSAREGVPNVVLEAMASGTACLLTPFVGLSNELGKHGKEYFLCHRNADSIALGISELLADDGLRRHIANAALVRAREQFSLEATLDQYVSLYQSFGMVGSR